MKAKSEHGITNAVHSMYGGDITTSGKNTQNKTNNHLYEEEEGVDVGEIVGHEDLELTNPTQENKVEGGKLITKTIIDEKGKEIKKKVKVLGTSSRLHLAYLLSLLLLYIWPQLVITVPNLLFYHCHSTYLSLHATYLSLYQMANVSMLDYPVLVDIYRREVA